MKKAYGFTIVELLIIIVVIAILAAISIVAYNGIQNRSYDTTIQNDLRSTANSIGVFRVDSLNERPPRYINEVNATFTTTRSAYHTGSDGVSNGLLYCANNDHFAIAARSKSGNIFYYSSADGGLVVSDDSAIGPVGSRCPALGVDNNAMSTPWLHDRNRVGGWRSDFTPGA